MPCVEGFCCAAALCEQENASGKVKGTLARSRTSRALVPEQYVPGPARLARAETLDTFSQGLIPLVDCLGEASATVI